LHTNASNTIRILDSLLLRLRSLDARSF